MDMTTRRASREGGCSHGRSDALRATKNVALSKEVHKQLKWADDNPHIRRKGFLIQKETKGNLVPDCKLNAPSPVQSKWNNAERELITISEATPRKPANNSNSEGN